jgi:hypothetical protein
MKISEKHRVFRAFLLFFRSLFCRGRGGGEEAVYLGKAKGRKEYS